MPAEETTGYFDTRQKLVDAVEEGTSQGMQKSQIADRVGVTTSTVANIQKNLKDGKEVSRFSRLKKKVLRGVWNNLTPLT